MLGSFTRFFVAILAFSAGVWVAEPTSQAHVATDDAWRVTYQRLVGLFPDADPQRWRATRYHLSEDDAQRLEDRLGYPTTPHDRRPTFYVAYDADGRFLGVAMFVRPHVDEPDLDVGHHHHDGHSEIEVGIGVGPKGAIARVAPYDIADAEALLEPEFLDQLVGRTLSSSFDIGDDIEPAAGYPESSQHVANAAEESLLYMRAALGPRRGRK